MPCFRYFLLHPLCAEANRGPYQVFYTSTHFTRFKLPFDGSRAKRSGCDTQCAGQPRFRLVQGLHPTASNRWEQFAYCIQTNGVGGVYETGESRTQATRWERSQICLLESEQPASFRALIRYMNPKRASKGINRKGRSILNFTSSQLCLTVTHPSCARCSPSDPIRHSAIATTLFGASIIGSFYYTVKNGRSAYVDATSLITGAEAPAELPTKASYTYQMKFR
jgi:hypothetical protein